MGKIFWILGAAVLAGSVYLVMKQPLGPLVSTDGVEDTASGIEGWGRRKRVVGTGGQLKGKVKQGAGDLLGDRGLSASGGFDQAVGAVQNAAGKAASAVGNAVRSLNK